MTIHWYMYQIIAQGERERVETGKVPFYCRVNQTESTLWSDWRSSPSTCSWLAFCGLMNNEGWTMLCGVNWGAGVNMWSCWEGRDAPLIIPWWSVGRCTRSPITSDLILNQSEANFTKRQETEKMKRTVLSPFYSHGIMCMEYYKKRTEVVVHWLQLKLTGIVVSRKWADFVQFLWWTNKWQKYPIGSVNTVEYLCYSCFD